jgi:acyl-CoA thioesterase-1
MTDRLTRVRRRARQLLVGSALLGTPFVALACGGGSPAPQSPIAPTPPVVITPPPSEPAVPVEESPAPAPPRPTLAVSRIVAFGDSLTEGVVSPSASMTLFVEIPQSYPFKLQALISERYREQTITVLNAGKAGERAEEGTERFIDALREGRPEVVLLMDGANDLLALGRRGIPRAIGGMETMIKEANRRGVQVLVATLPPQRAGAQRASAAPYVGEYNAELVKTAADEGARIVDVSGAISVSDVGVDGLHLTEAGYQKLAGVFLDALAALYERAPATTAASDRGRRAGPLSDPR